MKSIQVTPSTDQISIEINQCLRPSDNIGSVELRITRTGKKCYPTYVYGAFQVSNNGSILFYIDDNFKLQQSGWYSATVYLRNKKCGSVLINLNSEVCNLGAVSAIDGGGNHGLNPAPECEGLSGPVPAPGIVYPFQSPLCPPVVGGGCGPGPGPGPSTPGIAPPGAGLADELIAVTSSGLEALRSGVTTPQLVAAMATIAGLGTAASLDVGTAAGTVAAGNDSRMTDARAPLPHTHPLSDVQQSGATPGQSPVWSGFSWLPQTIASSGFISPIAGTAGEILAVDATGLVGQRSGSTALQLSTALTTIAGLGNSATRNVGAVAGTVAAGDDARLSNARTPTPHASTHAVGGTDPLTPAAIGAATAVALAAEIAASAAADASLQAQISALPSLAAHVAAVNPHPQYALTSTLGNSALLNVGTTAGTVAAGDDSRLTNSRTPTAHTHPLSDLQQSGATAAQVMQWNGAAWVPATIAVNPTSGPAIGWRIRQMVGNTPNSLSISELQFRGVLNGPTLCVGGNAIASSTIMNQGQAYYPSRAFDGLDTLWWNSDNLEPNPTLGYLFQSPVDVVQVMIKAISVAGIGAPRDFQIQNTYDGVIWITVSTVTNQTGWTESQERSFNI